MWKCLLFLPIFEPPILPIFGFTGLAALVSTCFSWTWTWLTTKNIIKISYYSGSKRLKNPSFPEFCPRPCWGSLQEFLGTSSYIYGLHLIRNNSDRCSLSNMCNIFTLLIVLICKSCFYFEKIILRLENFFMNWYKIFPYTAWVKKKSPRVFLNFFPKRLGIFSPNSTRPLSVPIKTRL